MEFVEVVRKRRMVRNYKPDRIDEEVVRRIVDVARRAPSAGFAQAQSFVVVTDERRRRAIAELAGEAAFTERGFDPWISRAPVHVVPCVDDGAYQKRYSEPDKRTDPDRWPVQYSLVDGGAALMLLLLAAVDEGLAAGFLGIHRLAGLRELLEIPERVTPLGVVTIGRPAPDRPSSSLMRGRRPIEETVHLERWGSGSR